MKYVLIMNDSDAVPFETEKEAIKFLAEWCVEYDPTLPLGMDSVDTVAAYFERHPKEDAIISAVTTAEEIRNDW